jgi:hypothetical protein
MVGTRMNATAHRYSLTGLMHANNFAQGNLVSRGLSIGKAVKVPGLEFSIILAIVSDLVCTPF